jgi:cyclase
MRQLRPAPQVLAFYDGRPKAESLPAKPTTWVEEGALSLGIASYVIVDGEEALVYDTHVSVDRAQHIRSTLGQMGVTRFTVVLSHWHLDHVAGTAAFSDCEVIASQKTLGHLARNKMAIEAGTFEGPPAIKPLVLPTKTIDGPERLQIGGIKVELIPTEIHSDDAILVWLPEQRLLFAGDTLEDTVTYIDEPDRLKVHLDSLAHLHELEPSAILPNHGDPDRIASCDYSAGLISATERYIEALLDLKSRGETEVSDIRSLLAGPLDAGWITYYEPYEAIHEANCRKLLESPA